jgi:hypothetical protein
MQFYLVRILYGSIQEFESSNLGIRGIYRISKPGAVFTG